MTDEGEGRVAALECVLLAMIEHLRRSDLVNANEVFQILGRATQMMARGDVGPGSPLKHASAEATFERFARLVGAPVHSALH